MHRGRHCGGEGGRVAGAEDIVEKDWQAKRVVDEKRSILSYVSSGCEVGWTWPYRRCKSAVQERGVQVLWAIMSRYVAVG